jgi:hypothetical protein
MRHPITKEQILATADLLAARDERVTLARVRQELGGGSYTTIGQALREWRRLQKKRPEAQPAVPPVPAQARTILKDVWGKLWRLAHELADTNSPSFIE